MTDDQGRSFISAEDYAVAFVDKARTARPPARPDVGRVLTP